MVIIAVVFASCGRNMEVIKVRLEDPEPAQPVDCRLPTAEDVDLLHESSSDPRVRKSLSLYHQGRFDDSRAVLASLLADDPTFWQAYFVMGLIDYKQQKYSETERDFQTALVFCPSDKRVRAAVYSALALTLEKTGQYGRAKQHFLTALNLDPGSHQARLGLQRLTALTSIDGR